MNPDQPNSEEREEMLPEDGATPFSSPNPIGDDSTDDNRPATLDDTHPSTDDGIEPEDEYEEGLSGAAGASQPNAGNMVTGYHKPGNGDDDEEDAEEE
jgi:hypothetical protein